MTLVKARLKNISAANPDPPDGIPVLFNPTEYSITRNAHYAEINVPGLQTPLLQFVRGESQVLEMELFLDRSETGESINTDIQNIRSFVTVTSSLHAPPVCEFHWGDTRFQGVMTSLKERFQMFDEDGKVLRARLTVSFKSYTPVEIQRREANPESPDRTKTHVVREGDRLDRIAAAEYGDPALWRVIAKKNNLDRARLLRPGMILTIPSL